MNIINTLRFITSHPLNRHQKMSALWRYATWQLGSRLLSGEGVVILFIGNARLLVRPGMTGATGNVYCGLHEFEDMAFLLHFLDQDDFFVDIGANVGSYTVLASAVIGARSLAFEPVPSTYKMLMDNIHINHIEDRVNAKLLAVSDNNGEIEMTSDRDTTNYAIQLQDNYKGEKIKVAVTCLTDHIKDQIPKLIKIDVEGYETNVIAGAEDIFANPELKAVIMELNGSGQRYGFDENLLHKKMLAFGFQAYRYNPFNRELTDLERKKSNLGNTLYLKDLITVQRIVSAARSFCVYGKEV